MEPRIFNQIRHCIEKEKQIMFLTGAGISAASGIPTFRGKDGFWVSGSVHYKAQEIGTYRMFQLASQEVWKWFLYRKSITEAAQPNPGHYLLKSIEDLLGERFVLVSQNVDSLHRKAGNSEERTYLIHGDMDFVRCGDACTTKLYPFPDAIDLKNRDKDVLTPEEWHALRCPDCGEDLRPHVLWFDEYYNERFYYSDTVLRHSKHTGLLFVIGTSGATNLPLAIVKNVLARQGMVVEVNIADNDIATILKDKKNGISVRQDSSAFLDEIYREIQHIVTPA